jgi:AspT/YidE/YbjL antiporter-like protein
VDVLLTAAGEPPLPTARAQLKHNENGWRDSLDGCLMLDWLFELAQTSPVAHALGLVALVCAAGMAVGSVKIKGIGLGSSGVLFAGILAAHFSAAIDSRTLTFIRELGLVLFVFTIGLQLGPGFFASLRAEGLRLNILAAVLVLATGILAPLFGWLIGLDSAAVAGLFAGASTNTPALGAAQQSLATLPGMTPERCPTRQLSSARWGRSWCSSGSFALIRNGRLPSTRRSGESRPNRSPGERC